ncbi:MAG: hypothetical protein SVU32_09005, partial [Candidatus Nanohaloarchaea archaeon]|nr:hypothetical protein [Candidatus Nanohaloarchaea archaeon]
MTEPCDADRHTACDHIEGSSVTVSIDPEEKWRWQHHADQFFSSGNSQAAHPGNRSKMIREYVQLGIINTQRDEIDTE